MLLMEPVNITSEHLTLLLNSLVDGKKSFVVLSYFTYVSLLLMREKTLQIDFTTKKNSKNLWIV